MVHRTGDTVEETWDRIADSFTTTRTKPWQQCTTFIDHLSPTSTVADLGCGNGRHTIPSAQHCKAVIALDLSHKLLCHAQQRSQQTSLTNILYLHADVVHLPLKDHSLDAILFIASLHNIKGREKRTFALKEIYRVLTPEGRALISVWSRWQDRYRRYFLRQLWNSKQEFGDIEIPWKHHQLNVSRFYHLYSKREFVRELRDAGFIIDSLENVRFHSRYTPDNYFAVVRKS